MANAEVIMPKMGDGMEAGKLLSWKKQDGDQVKVGEVIAEIETDKSNVEIEAEDAGVLKTQVSPGDSVPVGGIIAVIGDGTAAVSSTKSPEPVKPAAPSQSAPHPAQASPAQTVQATPQPSARNGEARTKASPLARRIAKERGIALDLVSGTGPNGRIIEADILAAEGGEKFRVAIAPAAKPASAPPPSQPIAPPTIPGELHDLSQMRRIIARRMAESKTQIPHFYVTSEIDMEAAIELRKQLNSYDDALAKISVNDFVVKASAMALMKAPEVNRIFQGDKYLQPTGAHVGIAVALDDGLIVPVIQDAQSKSLRSIARESKQLIEKARSRKLQPSEYSGGTFTVSNLGTFDVESFVAIIDPAQGAILAIGSSRKVPVVMPNDVIAIRQRMNVTLSGDHRVMDGATGAKFLQELKKLLQNPLSLLES